MRRCNDICKRPRGYGCVDQHAQGRCRQGAASTPPNVHPHPPRLARFASVRARRHEQSHGARIRVHATTSPNQQSATWVGSGIAGRRAIHASIKITRRPRDARKHARERRRQLSWLHGEGPTTGAVGRPQMGRPWGRAWLLPFGLARAAVCERGEGGRWRGGARRRGRVEEVEHLGDLEVGADPLHRLDIGPLW